MKDIFRSYAVFDAEGRHTWGTDKESNHHFGDAYEKLFHEWIDLTSMSYYRSTRVDVNLMMEVGVADGSSLLAWRECFPNALIVGLDLVPDAGHRLRDFDRIEFHTGDATKREDCARAAAGRLFDLIVDDAAHHLQDLLRTLFWLWPSIRPGGLYVVEDWEDITLDEHRITALFPNAQVVPTVGPHVAYEPLVVFRKPL
jgi:hypothetical protein